MSSTPDLRGILLTIRREIELGIIDLTEEETALVEALQDVFPQYLRVVLMAVVYLHSHALGCSAENLEGDCSNFLLGEDWENMADALLADIPEAYQDFVEDSTPDISIDSIGEDSAVPGTSEEKNNELPKIVEIKDVFDNVEPGDFKEDLKDNKSELVSCSLQMGEQLVNVHERGDSIDDSSGTGVTYLDSTAFSGITSKAKSMPLGNTGSLSSPSISNVYNLHRDFMDSYSGKTASPAIKSKNGSNVALSGKSTKAKSHLKKVLSASTSDMEHSQIRYQSSEVNVNVSLERILASPQNKMSSSETDAETSQGVTKYQSAPGIIYCVMTVPSTNKTKKRVASTSKTENTAVPSTSKTENTAVPSTSKTENTAVPSTSKTENIAVPSTSKTENTAVPSTSKTENTAVPSTNKTENTPVPSASKTENTAVPSTSKTENTAVPSTSKTEYTAVPSARRTKNTAVPSTSKTKNTPVPSARKIKNTSVPSTSKTENTPVPSTSKSENTAVPLTSKTENTAVPSTIKTKNTPVPSTSKIENTPGPSTSKTKNTAVPSTSKIGNTPGPSTSKTKNIPVPSTSKIENTPGPSTSKTKNTPVQSTSKMENTPLSSTRQKIVIHKCLGCPSCLNEQLSDAESIEDVDRIVQAPVTTDQSVTGKDYRVSDQPDQTHRVHATNNVNLTHPDNNPMFPVFTMDRVGPEILPHQQNVFTKREGELIQKRKGDLVQERQAKLATASVLLGTKPLFSPARLHLQSQRKPLLQPSKLVVVTPHVFKPAEQQEVELLQRQVSARRHLYNTERPEDQPGPSGLQRAPPVTAYTDPNPRQGRADTPIVIESSQEEAMMVDEEATMIDDNRWSQEDDPQQHPGLASGVQTVMEVFPTVDQEQVTQVMLQFLDHVPLDQALNMTITHFLLEPPPVVPHGDNEVRVLHMEDSAAKEKDYYKPNSDWATYSSSLAVDRLSMEFRNVRVDTINEVLVYYKGHYAPTFRCLKQAMDHFIAKHEEEYGRKAMTRRKKSNESMITLKMATGDKEHTKMAALMKSVRVFCQRKMDVTDPELLAEIEFVKQRKKQDNEDRDHHIAWSLLETEYEEQGQSIECGCCFVEYPFENLVQCFEGHLFCCQCLLGYAREAIFGSGKLNLHCMTADCNSRFPRSQLDKALPPEVIKKYEERMTEEDLNKAAMEDLVRCPACNMAVVVDPHVQHFQCPNSTCMKEMCRKCKEDWSDHKGKTCKQVEKKDETKLRISYEEKMTQTRVRRCLSCQAQFYKEEGCNKMTCRCGDTMCYICREPHINYEHFCRHPRDPGKDCTVCKNCSLWTNPEEDEKRAIAEIQKEAQEKRKEQGYFEEKLIGAPDEPAIKKYKMH